MPQNFDAIVVGSGPAGISAAWPLVRAGIRVLMLDASDTPPPPPPRSPSAAAFRSDPAGWKARFGADLAGVMPPAGLSPKFATPAARAALGGFSGRLGLSSRGFLAAGSLGQGGLSTIWGALAVRFEAAERAGFPFPAEALDASYAAVSRRIGLGAPAMPESPAARAVLERWTRRGPEAGLRLEPAPNAVLAAPQDGRGACTRCGLCLYGCGQGSIYASGDELPALGRFPNFSYRPCHLVREVEADPGGQRLIVETGGAVHILTAPIAILAAGTLATTGLALRRIGWLDRPVRLLTNPAAATAFVVPGLIGADLPERGVSLGQLFYRLGAEGGDASAGVLYGADALPLDLLAARLPVGRPFALRLARALAPALVLASCYLPGRLSRNTLTASRRGGSAGLAVTGEQPPETVACLRADLSRLRRALLPLGALPLPGSASILQPGADAHYAGTLPMGGQGGPATTEFGELAGCAGLFVADGACLPHLPAAHPTLTIMANADRIGREVARRILAGDAVGGLQPARPPRAA